MVHNPNMTGRPQTLLLFLALTLAAGLPPALAQDQGQDPDQARPPAAPADSSSRTVEESDEAFRRRMELEDARNRNAIYTVPSAGASSSKGLEKIDKLPAASRDNIRDQLVEVIMENGEWEPFDALREYPYEPTAAAQAEPRLLEQEQEAWDEQIQKYHQREAAAYGATRGPVPGEPAGAKGSEGGGTQGEQGAGDQGSEQGGEQGDEQGGAAGGKAGASGTYQPYEPNRKPAEEAVSTAGAQQSALDFLRGQQGQTAAAASAAPEAESGAESEAAAESGATESGATESGATESEPELIDTRGIIAIEDLDKLEGAAAPQEPEDSPEDSPMDSEKR
jgi:hypothetical protein